MANSLIKSTNITYIPGHPAIPASPGQPWLPARDVAVSTTLCENVATTSYEEVTVQTGWTEPGFPTSFTFTFPTTSYTYTCTTVTVVQHLPQQPYIAPTPPQPAVASQTVIDLNLGWNAGARSQRTFEHSGEITFQAERSVVGAVVGLNDVDVDAGYATIDYAWYLAGGVARVYENGVEKAYVGPYDGVDVFAIRRVYGEVAYLINGVEEYVSTVPSDGAMFMDVSLYAGGDAINNPTIRNLAMCDTTMEAFAGIGYDATAVQLNTSHTSMLPMTAFSRPAVRVAVSMLPMDAQASNRIYGDAAVSLRALQGFAQGGMPVPSFSIANTAMAYFTNAAFGFTGEVGGADVSMVEIDSLGSGDDSLETMKAYGESDVAMAPILSAGYAYEGNTNATIWAVSGMSSVAATAAEIAVVLAADMTVAAVIAYQALQDASMPSEAQLSAGMSTESLLEAIMRTLVTAGALSPVFEEPHEVWAVNADTGASSQYENYGFNSFGRIGDAYFGCKADGIYRLEGDTDAGEAIRASVNLGLQNFKTSAIKRVVNAYVGVASTGALLLKVTANGADYIYQARRSDETLRTQRFDIGKGLRATYFEFELFNSDGCDFDISTVEFLPIATSRRI